jgi:hypothetical protein
MNHYYGSDGAHNPSNNRLNAPADHSIQQLRYIGALTEAMGPMNVAAPVSDDYGHGRNCFDFYDVEDHRWIKVFRIMDYGAIRRCINHPTKPRIVIDVGAFARSEERCPTCNSETMIFGGEYGAFLNEVKDDVLLYCDGGLWHPSICFEYDGLHHVWELIAPFNLREQESE